MAPGELEIFEQMWLANDSEGKFCHTATKTSVLPSSEGRLAPSQKFQVKISSILSPFSSHSVLHRNISSFSLQVRTFNKFSKILRILIQANA